MSARAFSPEWPAPSRVRAWVTERGGGVSTGAYESLNLALHVGDDPKSVEENRQRVAATFELPSEPCWLEQVHGNCIAEAGRHVRAPVADGAVADRPGIVCAVLTADCLPVILCDRAGTRVGIAHAGWRGLACGVIKSAVEGMSCAPRELIAWLGPAISAASYEVGEEVRASLLEVEPAAGAAFARNARGRFQADLYTLARLQLAQAGVEAVYGGDFCTYAEPSRFFSHRRSAPCGRMATLIWLAR